MRQLAQLLLVIAILATGSIVMAQETAASEEADSQPAKSAADEQPSVEERARLQQEYVATAAKLLEDLDYHAAVAHVVAIENDALACNVFGDLLFMFYYEKKDLTTALAFGNAAVQHALASAAKVQRTDRDRAAMFREYARAMCYNIASFTWPGWDEAGIVIEPAHLTIGRDAAKANFRLAVVQGSDPFKLCNAYWLIGAHELAAGRHDAARDAFRTGQNQASIAGKQNLQLMNQGYALLADILAGHEAAAAEQELEDVLKQLAPLEEGEFFANQIKSVRKVFETPDE